MTPRLVLVAPCGAGKTVMSTAIIKLAVDRGKQVLFLAHGRQLIFQKSRTLDKADIEHMVLMSGEEYSKYSATQAKVIVASKDTYWARAFERDQIEKFRPDLVIVDEAHGAMTDSWMALLPKDLPVIGMTATPAMPDGTGLGKFYNGLVTAANYRELIEKELIVPARVYAPVSVDYRGLTSQNGDWSWDAIADRFKGLTGDIIQHWIKLAENRPTAVFASNVEHSVALCRQFNAMGIPALHIDSDTPQEERDEAFAAVVRGDVRVLCNFGVLTVGFDLPCLGAAVLAFSTNSLVKYLQVCGRVLRPFPGKTDAIIIDHGDNVRRHMWPTEDHDWRLHQDEPIAEREAEKREKQERELITCYECGALRKSGPVCDHCGAQRQRRGSLVRTRSGELEEIKPRQVKAQTPTPRDESKLWMNCLAMAANRGGTITQARVIFNKSCGHYPPPHIQPMPPRSDWNIRVAKLYPGFVRRKKV